MGKVSEYVWKEKKNGKGEVKCKKRKITERGRERIKILQKEKGKRNQVEKEKEGKESKERASRRDEERTLNLYRYSTYISKLFT